MFRESTLGIRYKLLLVLLCLACGAVLVSGYISNASAARALTEAALRQLNGTRRSKAQQVESHFAMLRNLVVTLSGEERCVTAMRDFRTAFRKIDGPGVPRTSSTTWRTFIARTIWSGWRI